MKLTPVLVVEDVQKSLAFWVDRMGFTKTAEVPDDACVAFAMLENAGAEIMLQSVDSVRKDEPKFAPSGATHKTSLFIETDDFADTLRRLDGYEIAMPERTTFYGMRDVGVFEPGGNIVVFSTRV